MFAETKIKQSQQAMDYMDKVDKDIRKMLVIARKKQLERER